MVDELSFINVIHEKPSGKDTFSFKVIYCISFIAQKGVIPLLHFLSIEFEEEISE
jgi:hypothetical protein